MKNKRNVLLAFLVVCFLCLGIGYAALTDVLTINGTVNVDVVGDPDDPADTPIEELFDESLGWTKVVLTSKTAGNAWSVKNTTDGANGVIDNTGIVYDYLDTVCFDVSGFVKPNDNVVLTYTIGNKHPDLSAKITKVAPEIVGSGAQYFEVETNITNDTVAAKSETTVTVTVTMVRTPTDDKEATITLAYNAEAVE